MISCRSRPKATYSGTIGKRHIIKSVFNDMIISQRANPIGAPVPMEAGVENLREANEQAVNGDVELGSRACRQFDWAL